MNTQNITLSVPKDVLLKVKLIAVKPGTSISGLITRVLGDIVAKDEGYQTARRLQRTSTTPGRNLQTLYPTAVVGS